MIELGVMRPHLLQKVLPFTAALALGILSAGVSQRFGALNVRLGTREHAATTHSRTWLLIHTRSAPVRFTDGRGNLNNASVHLRVRFNADGTTSVLTPTELVMYQPDDLFEAMASDLVQHIKFTPPTEDGKPLSVLAEIDYDPGIVCAAGYRRRDHLPCIFTDWRSFPIIPTVKIISVEGAKESEGWRVVYE